MAPILVLIATGIADFGMLATKSAGLAAAAAGIDGTRIKSAAASNAKAIEALASSPILPGWRRFLIAY